MIDGVFRIKLHQGAHVPSVEGIHPRDDQFLRPHIFTLLLNNDLQIIDTLLADLDTLSEVDLDR